MSINTKSEEDVLVNSLSMQLFQLAKTVEETFNEIIAKKN
jgi:hypothetical protein